jgi:polysaccharide deacetylase 2 family uncharacterized protein YibQ
VINPTITDLSTVAGTKVVSTMDVIENTAASATNAATNATNIAIGTPTTTEYQFLQQQLQEAQEQSIKPLFHRLT